MNDRDLILLNHMFHSGFLVNESKVINGSDVNPLNQVLPVNHR